MGKNAAKVALPILGLGAAATGIGALAAPALIGGGAAAAGAAGAAGATAGAAGLTGGTAAALGAGATGALAGGAGLAAKMATPIAMGNLGSSSVGGAASVLGRTSQGLNLAQQGMAPFLMPQQPIPVQRPNGNLGNLRSLSQGYYS